ncbi:MAG: hypothetical protein ABSF83_03270 [Nitrososphaerales archaeon]|jgi:hypothetical protein
MTGVGNVLLTRELDDGRKLLLRFAWDPIPILRDGTEQVSGQLPGSGTCSYVIAVTEKTGHGDGHDEQNLQEFVFDGGGYLESDHPVPPVVKEAYDRRFEELSRAVQQRSRAPDITVRYVGSAATEEIVDGAIAAVRADARRGLHETIELTPELAERVRKEHELLDGLRSARGTGEPPRPRSGARVKGLFLRIHPDVDELGVAFIEYANCWLVSGQVGVPYAAFEARGLVLDVLDSLRRAGVQLTAKEVWLREDGKKTKMEWKIGENFNQDEYHADAAARGENPYYPGLPAAPPGGYRFPNPTGVWKTEARAWLDSHPSSRYPRVTREEVDALYAAGATNVDIAFNRGPSGLDVTPPIDREARRRLVELIMSRFERHWEDDEDGQRWARWAIESNDVEPWVVL